MPTAPIRSRYCAVRRIGTLADRSVDHDRVAGDHDGIAGKRGRDLDPGAVGRRRERRRLLAVARRADRFDDHPPRAVAVGRTVERRRSGRHHRESQGDGSSTERDGQQRADTEARPGLAQQQDRGEAQGDGRPEMVRRDLAAQRRPRRSPRSPGGCSGPCQRTVTRSLSEANVFSPTSLRVRRSSTDANGCSSRDATILAAVTGPIPGSVSSSPSVARFRSIGPAAPEPARPCRPRRPAALMEPLRRPATGPGSGHRP